VIFELIGRCELTGMFRIHSKAYNAIDFGLIACIGTTKRQKIRLISDFDRIHVLFEFFRVIGR